MVSRMKRSLVAVLEIAGFVKGNEIDSGFPTRFCGVHAGVVLLVEVAVVVEKARN